MREIFISDSKLFQSQGAVLSQQIAKKTLCATATDDQDQSSSVADVSRTYNIADLSLSVEMYSR